MSKLIRVLGGVFACVWTHAHAVELGVDGILVSNHGARQLDAAPASIMALPAIVDAVSGRASVLLDSGVRSGTDIIGALALGADFVLLGRAFMFGVAALGEAGGDHTVDLLLADIRSNMSNLGCATVAELRQCIPVQARAHRP